MYVTPCLRARNAFAQGARVPAPRSTPWTGQLVTPTRWSASCAARASRVPKRKSVDAHTRKHDDTELRIYTYLCASSTAGALQFPCQGGSRKSEGSDAAAPLPAPKSLVTHGSNSCIKSRSLLTRVGRQPPEHRSNTAIRAARCTAATSSLSSRVPVSGTRPATRRRSWVDASATPDGHALRQ